MSEVSHSRRVESFRSYDSQMVDCIDGWFNEPPRKLAPRKRRSPDAAQRAALLPRPALAGRGVGGLRPPFLKKDADAEHRLWVRGCPGEF
ncbi:hypothetical protein [Bradyrhizobium sp.]|uniref:hypothetical protein n=1 Tax=Bradyrhizobium sp. TaxID=376 RepID=UPI003C7953E4